MVPLGMSLEEGLGLRALFALRGSRAAPPEVVIVGIDRRSWETLGLPENPERWPRSLHSRLTDGLARAGAAVIAFDIIFEEPRFVEEDRLFADAMARAGTVVLCESLHRQLISIAGKDGAPSGEITVERLIVPAAQLAESALGLGPFPLPKVPVTVSRYWTFKTEAGSSPTLPIVAFQVYSRGFYGDLIGLIEEQVPEVSGKLPEDAPALVKSGRIERQVSQIRDLFERYPDLGERIRRELSNRDHSALPTPRGKMLASLVRMYESPDSPYLNFYGPPRTITTLSYVDVLRASDRKDAHLGGYDLRGKAVFVGVSDPHPEQKDGFHTVFSDSGGVDISGVEIAATAFGNLLEDSPVKPLPARFHLVLVLIWGLFLGFLNRVSSTAVSLAGALAVGAMYLIVAVYQFKAAALWCPVVAPLLIQMPLALFGGLLWRYLEAVKERRNIRKALGFYLPDHVVARVAKDLTELQKSSQVIYGTCLCTDAEHYTTLAEQLDPKDLADLMNRYFETVFDPVRRHGGIISNVVADSMLALWVTAGPVPLVREQACSAALEISSATRAFNALSAYPLPTRVGVHSGDIILGALGALDHFEYRPIGDIVNTATRIEGLNKYLGTGVLISEEMVGEGFLTRELGAFLLAGKAKPLVIHELLCRDGVPSEDLRELRGSFGQALAAFRRRAWSEAEEAFAAIVARHGGDGPSAFYAALCRAYQTVPPQEPWDGAVRAGGK